MGRRLPVITGISAICSLGCNPGRVVNRLLMEKTHFFPVPFEGEYFRQRQIASVPDDDFSMPPNHKRFLGHMSRETQFAVTACLDCIKDAAIEGAYADEAIGLFAGTGCSGMRLETIQKLMDHSVHPLTGHFDVDAFGRTALFKMNPLTSFQILPNMPAATCAIIAGLKGPNLVFNPWEGNALLALYEATFEIKSGRSNLVLCGGSDCKTHSNAFLTFSEYGFLKDSGVVLSEGSGYLALEARPAAEFRKQAIYCTLRHMQHGSLPDSGTKNADYLEAFYSQIIATTLKKSGLTSEDIDLVLSSTDFTTQSDAAENKALASAFACPVIAPKQIMGNAYAAAGLLNVIIAAQILQSAILVQGRQIGRIFITSFAPGSEKFCIIVEKP